MSENAWPELSWIPTRPRRQWLVDRVSEVGQRTRAFEVALEQAAAAGEVDLPAVAEVVAEWANATGNVWMYAGLGEAKSFPATEVAYHAGELEKIYASLLGLRGQILKQVGKQAASVLLARETAVEVDPAEFMQRAGELPAPIRTDMLGAEIPEVPAFMDDAARPISGDELRMRQTAEGKLLPESRKLGALLSQLPTEWVSAVFTSLGIVASPDVEMTAGSRTAMRRGLIHGHLTDEEALRQTILGSEDEDWELLLDLIKTGGTLTYADVTTRHGKDDADGFFWLDRQPSSPLARLRRRGLAFVAMHRSQLVVQLPVDLLPLVQKLVAEIP